MVAAVDLGTNSARLLITEGGQEVLRRTEIVRLGQDVDRTGRLAPEALERTRAVLGDYAQDLARHDVRAVRVVATSATRDASNRSDLVYVVQTALGVEPDVVTGLEEARLTFAGATRGLAATAPYLIVDIGGGSTECTLGGAAGVTDSVSVDLGCVRLTERHLAAQRERRPTVGEVRALVADVERGLDVVAESVALRAAATVVCVAGTATTVAALALGLTAYDPDAIHLADVGVGQLDGVLRGLLTSTVADVAALPAVHPGRADVLTAGALVLRAVLARTGQGRFVVSEHDMLDGIARDILERGRGDWRSGQ